MNALLLLSLAALSAAPEVKPLDTTAASDSSAMATGPLQSGLLEGDVGLVRRGVPRTELGLAVRPALTIDSPGFYGNVVAGLELSGSYQLGQRSELFGSLTALQFRFLQNATLKKTQLSLGPTSLGASCAAIQQERFTLATFIRAHLPTSSEFVHVRPFGFEPGVVIHAQPMPTLAWHAGATLPLSFGDSLASGAHPQLLVTALAGAQWLPFTWFSVVAELGSQVNVVGACADGSNCFAPPRALQQVTAGLGLRFKAGNVGFELEGLVPFAGASRVTGAGSLKAAYRF